MTWTSIATPDSRITLPITEPRVSRCQRERRVAPMTICVAFSERAASSSASPMSAPDDLVVGAAELLHELALLGEQRGRGRGEPVLGDDVDGDEVALRALRDPRGAADEPLAVGGAGEGDEHALARLPRLLDPVPAAVLGEALVDTVGEPGERELAQRGEVARAGSSWRARCRSAPAGRRRRGRAGCGARAE